MTMVLRRPPHKSILRIRLFIVSSRKGAGPDEVGADRADAVKGADSKPICHLLGMVFPILEATGYRDAEVHDVIAAGQYPAIRSRSHVSHDLNLAVSKHVTGTIMWPRWPCYASMSSWPLYGSSGKRETGINAGYWLDAAGRPVKSATAFCASRTTRCEPRSFDSGSSRSTLRRDGYLPTLRRSSAILRTSSWNV